LKWIGFGHNKADLTAKAALEERNLFQFTDEKLTISAPI